jgi:hypothetical protein
MAISRLKFLALILPFLSACGTPTPVSTPQVVNVQYTAAAQPWLADLYDCADRVPGTVLSADQRVASTLDPESADLILRVGAPPKLDMPSFAVGEEEIKVIVNPKNPVAGLTRAQLAALFMGQSRNWKEVGGGEAPVQVWVFPTGEDLQQIFDGVVLQGAAISSLARQAADPDQMVQAIASDAAAIGILSLHSVTEDVRAVSLPDDLAAQLEVPVLAITAGQPQGVRRDLLACMQK